MGTYKDLRVWQDAVRLAVEVYRLTERFPAEERYGLTSQMRRAAVSVSSNVAEGKGRSSAADFGRFLDMAIGSVFEVESQIEVAVALGFLDRGGIGPVTELIDRTGRGLTRLKQTILGTGPRSNQPPPSGPGP